MNMRRLPYLLTTIAARTLKPDVVLVMMITSYFAARSRLHYNMERVLKFILVF